MAATWDLDLVGEVAAKILAPECKLKAASMLLGPTCNIQRVNRDLSRTLLRLMNREGISACIKHLVGNEQEQERRGSDSLNSDRPLQESYLYPFILAQKNSKPWSYMTASVISPPIVERSLISIVQRVAEFVKKVATSAPEILDGDQKERTYDTRADAALLRKVASNAIVLLKNNGAILPLKAENIKTLAIIGPSAKQMYCACGGSASLNASYVVTPTDGIVAALPKNVNVVYAEGCQGHKRAPILTDHELTTPKGTPGMKGTFYLKQTDNGQYSEPTDSFLLDNMNSKMHDSDIFFAKEEWYMVLEGRIRPVQEKTEFRLGPSVSGRARLFLDDTLLIDLWSWGPGTAQAR
ncbi:hypothetical protein DACRYDRAFT_18936 [Dacryopinax primogenitus]|uniref:beta-glucosidase n=1 Tax=Dacryopinax primogenitus (strain DJM 731) TaxID=1858805 RepID=M5FQZ9_DACPD|nr:uncharacterized protein DACRYDRAFT_18936 [Dacryopinax primogenitus]EJT97239.1 hypothetical protein DACRYDRAFT_18936 [Dacryopinax primogenitus]